MADDLSADAPTTTVVRRQPTPIVMGDRGIRLATFEDAFRFAKLVVSSGLAPKGIDTAEKALIAIQYGAELGFSPMRALSVITVVNGRPGIYGEAALAKISETGVCAIPPVMRHEGDGDDHCAIVRFQRHSQPDPVEVRFSVGDAKKARLWGKAGPWTDYSDDMLGWRAVGRMVKRYFGDVTLGLVIVEELRDYPVQPSRDAAPPPEPDPLLVNAPLAETQISAAVGEPSAELAHDDDPSAELKRNASAFVATLKAINTIAGVEHAWRSAKDLRDAVDTDTLDTMTLAYEARLDELKAK